MHHPNAPLAISPIHGPRAHLRFEGQSARVWGLKNSKLRNDIMHKINIYYNVPLDLVNTLPHVYTHMPPAPAGAIPKLN